MPIILDGTTILLMDEALLFAYLKIVFLNIFIESINKVV